MPSVFRQGILGSWQKVGSDFLGLCLTVGNFAPVFVIPNFTRHHEGLAEAFIYTKLVPIALNFLP